MFNENEFNKNIDKMKQLCCEVSINEEEVTKNNNLKIILENNESIKTSEITSNKMH